MYFDDIMDWRKRYQDKEFDKIDGDLKLVIHMPTSTTLELSFDPQEDELKCKFEVVREQEPKMSVFDLPPPIFPARIVVLTFEVLRYEKVHVIFAGNTRPFQANFVRHNIKGKTVKAGPEDPHGEYLRVMENLSVADERKCVEHLNVVFDDILQNSPVLIRVKETEQNVDKLIKIIDHFKEKG